MEQRVLARLRRLRRPGCCPPLLGLGLPVLGQSEVMAFGLEHRPSLLEQRDTLRLCNGSRPREVEHPEPHRGSGSRDWIARRSRFREDLEGALVCRLLVHVRELRRVRESTLVARRENGGGPPEGRAWRGGGTAFEGSAARRGEVLRCAAGEAEQLGGFWVELPAVAVRLLEVVADDLVCLDQFVRREPVGELLVQLRSRRLRQRLVRSIADEQMPEAETLVHRKRRWCRADQLLADKRGEMLLHAALQWCGRQPDDGASMEHLTLYCPPLHHNANVAIESVYACLEQRLDRGWNHDLPVAAMLAHHREHLLDIQRIAGRCLRDALPQHRVEHTLRSEAIHQIGALFRRQRLEQQRRRVHLAAAPSRTNIQ